MDENVPANLLREVLVAAIDSLTQDFLISTRDTQLCTSCGAKSVGPADSRLAIMSLPLKQSTESLQDAISRLFKSWKKKCSSNLCGTMGLTLWLHEGKEKVGKDGGRKSQEVV